MNITFSTCWYAFKCKFEPSIYQRWIDNMLSNVNNYYLVIYTDTNSLPILQQYEINPKIKIVILSHEDFYTYKYKDNWIANHEINSLLKHRIDWKVNMLWSEKVYFVYNTLKEQYFETDWYGWCDIGYFRDNNDKNNILNWPSHHKINGLDKDKIHYALVNQNTNELKNIITNKNDVGLPIIPIPPDQMSIAGGFFISHKDKINWWKNTFYHKLQLYFEHKYFFTDDQTIIIDCIYSEPIHFHLHTEDSHHDMWFLFQRVLL